MYIYIYIYIQGGYAPFRRSWSSNNNNSEQGGVEDLGGRLLGSILECFEGFKVQVGGLGGPFEFHFRSSRGLGGQEATGKGFGKPWVGPGAAGDPEMDPT